MIQIRSKKDAREFVKFANSFTYYDKKHGGTTRIINERVWKCYSWGQDYPDYVQIVIDDIIKYLWQNRASINAQIKLDAQINHKILNKK